MVDDKLLERIKKLLALSTSDNPHEASLALQKAQALMAEHDVTTSGLLRSEIGTVKVRSPFTISKMKDYEAQLAAAVGAACGCKVLWLKGNSWDYKATSGKGGWGWFGFVGQKAYLQVAEYLMETLSRKLQRARANYIKTSYTATSKDADSFCLGWSVGVRKHVAALAVNDELRAAIEEETKQLSGDKSAKERKSEWASPATAAGYAQGSQESLHRGVGGAAERRMIA